MKKLLLFFVAVLPFACGSDDEDQGLADYDYIVFGDYYGYCQGKCVSIYKLEASKLFTDTLQKYPYPGYKKAYEGKYEPLGHDLYDQVKDLPEGIPYTKLKSKDVVIGQPDAGDWGGIYLEVSVKGHVDYWFLDKMESNLPDDLKGFVAQLNKKIAVLKTSGN